jgi:D-glycero-D-manno-heptose 1,7-bisphosphate phosphatase
VTDSALRPALFLDRDGTLMEDRHYVSRPEDVVLISGAAAAVRRVNQAGVLVVVVTNQSGLGRGLFDEAAYERVRARLDELLAAAGARIDATYHCPHGPDLSPPCECRKPGRLLFDRAVADLGIDPSRTACIGDRLRDIEPAKLLGGRGVLVPSRDTPTLDMIRASDEFAVATSIEAAVARVLPYLTGPRP